MKNSTVIQLGLPCLIQVSMHVQTTCRITSLFCGLPLKKMETFYSTILLFVIVRSLDFAFFLPHTSWMNFLSVWLRNKCLTQSNVVGVQMSYYDVRTAVLMMMIELCNNIILANSNTLLYFLLTGSMLQCLFILFIHSINKQVVFWKPHRAYYV